MFFGYLCKTSLFSIAYIVYLFYGLLTFLLNYFKCLFFRWLGMTSINGWRNNKWMS